MVLDCMGTIGVNMQMVLETCCCQTGIFGSEGRGNRFPSGRTRVPVCEMVKLGIFEIRNRLLLGRNRVPRYIFPKKTENFLGTGSLPGGTGFPIHFSRSVLFLNCGNRVLPGRNRVPL